MARYKVGSEWSDDKMSHVGEACIVLQRADITDTKTGDKFRDGAYRVQVSGKSVKGKGGTAPFFGESAWSAGERLFFDTVFAAQRAL